MKRIIPIIFCYLTIFALLLSCDSTISRETVNSQYFKSECLFKYLVELPEGFDSTATYDLMVGLHGLGSDAEEFMGIINRIASKNLILVTLQAPYAVLENEKLGYDWNLYDTEDWELIFQAGDLTVESISDLLAELEKEFKIDKTYLLGFSQGGTQALYTGITRPDLTDGVITFGCRFDPEWFSESHINNMKELRVFLAHGYDDPRVSVEDSKVAYSFLESSGAEVELEIFDGAHEVPEDVLREAIEWIEKGSAY